MQVERVGYASSSFVREVDLDGLVDRKRDDASLRHQLLRLVLAAQDLEQYRDCRRYEGVVIDEEVGSILLYDVLEELYNFIEIGGSGLTTEISRLSGLSTPPG